MAKRGKVRNIRNPKRSSPISRVIRRLLEAYLTDETNSLSTFEEVEDNELTIEDFEEWLEIMDWVDKYQKIKIVTIEVKEGDGYNYYYGKIDGENLCEKTVTLPSCKPTVKPNFCKP